MHPPVTLFVVALCILGVCQCYKQRLLVVLLDGVRWDYVNRDPELRGFARIAREGVKVNYVTPIFPSVSYPNWYTIATGLYAESHGFVDNTMYDEKRNDTFLMGPHPNVTHEHWWNKTEPIWAHAERNGKRTAMHYWDGCQVPIRGVKPMQCEPYREFWLWTGVKQETLNKMLEVLEWFEEMETHRLALIYYEGPDAYGHKYGPDSEELRQELRDTDQMLDMFQDKLEASSIKDQINLMIVSDHGMSYVQNSTRIRVETLDGHEDMKLSMAGGAQGRILPTVGKETQVSDKLKASKVPGLHVYQKEEIPEQYHLKHGELTMPILLVADLGNILLMPNRSSDNVSVGTHGFDPYVKDSRDTNEMRTIMYARGPAFKRGVVGLPIQQTDHYNIFCHILDLKPQPNNGSWNRVSPLLINSATYSIPTHLLLIPMTSLTLCNTLRRSVVL